MSRVVNVVKAIARHELHRYPACELAVVTSVFDGEDGDDTLSVSIQLKDTALSIPRVPVMVGLTGLAALPRVGDVVLVLFPRGDLASAVVVGQVYSEKRRPPEFVRDEIKLSWPGDADDPDTDAIKVSVLGTSGERTVEIALGGDSDAKVTIKEGEIQLAAGGVQVKLAHGSSSDGTVEVSGGGTSIILAQDGDLTLESKGTLTLKANKVAIESDTQIKVNGQTVEIN